MSQDGASPLASPEPRVQPASLGHVASWALVGRLTYAGCQWGMLVVLAKVRSAKILMNLYALRRLEAAEAHRWS